MKRDMELIRQILLRLEEHESEEYPEFEIDGCTDYRKQYHLVLLAEAGLIEGIGASHGMEFQFEPRRLTWQGHEFLDDVRSETVWRKTKETIGEQLGSVSLSIVQEVAKASIKSFLGLQP